MKNKKLILFSDGTGNTGGGVNSNVWRLYEAIEIIPDQVTFYDDGVGTQENKAVRAISGGTGIGIRKNVKQLYAFLLQQYEPGDQIYLFGFSRGAFTARVLSNLLFYCGIADARGLLPEQIEQLAEQAVRAYEKRSFCDPHQGPPAEFRKNCGLKHDLNVNKEPGWFRLHFVGVWDTVEAYGLPVDELADALSWLFPLRFQEEGRLCENDLHPLIDNGYHAIAIDDERHAFHPKLWIENAPFDFDPQTKKNVPRHGSERVMALGATSDRPNPQPSPGRVIRQVWFAGMHSNVGGGYAQDQMAHVTLLWMMEQAHAGGRGLIFNKALWDEYKQVADENGRMYDSRSGTGCYYRYRPRDLSVLCADAGITQPIIHHTVFDRIKRHTQAYAPTGVPERYSVEPPTATSGELRPSDRLKLHEYVDDLIWKRRALYGFFIVVSLCFLGTLWCLASHPTVPKKNSWFGVTQVLDDLLQPIVKVGQWIIPEYFEAGWVELGNRPWWLFGFGAAFFVCNRLSKRWATKIQSTSNLGWAISFPASPGIVPVAPTSLVRSFRKHPLPNRFAEWFQGWFAPKALLIGLVLGTFYILHRWILYRWLGRIL